MTNTNGPDDRDAGGKEKRPYTTLDLKANEVSPDKDKQSAASTHGSKEQLRLNKPDEKATAPDQQDRWAGILTHAAAGAIGAALTLMVALWIFGNTDGSGANGPAVANADVEALRTALTDAEAKIAALETDLKSVSESANSAQKQETELASLFDRIAVLESRPAAAAITEQSVQQSIDPITSQMAEIERRLTALADMQQARRVDGKSMAVSLAFYNLQRAAREGKPYARELKTVEQNAPVPLDLAALEPWGDEGVKSLGQLRESFDVVAKAAIDAENQPVDESIAAEVWSRAKSFVRIRRKGHVEGEYTGAILARIEYNLQNRDVKAALAEAEQLQGPAAEAVAPWVAELKRKLAAEEALAQIETKLLGTIGGSKNVSRDG
ncbi:MAG: hypothetical protein KTR19_10565 [Hyphomicrobiales bacterium]|nr:hypothetical protein [Hyphomicrobiales bacterium]